MSAARRKKNGISWRLAIQQLTLTEWGAETHFQFDFVMPHSVNINYWFAIRSHFLTALNDLSDLEQH